MTVTFLHNLHNIFPCDIKLSLSNFHNFAHVNFRNGFGTVLMTALINILQFGGQFYETGIAHFQW